MKHVQEIRDELIFQLYGAGQSIALQLQTIQRQAKRGGFDYTEKEIMDQLYFLRDQGYLVFERDALGVERYRITAAGCLFKESNS